MSTKITKNQTAEVKTKTGSNYSYQYVDIAQIHDYLESINARYIQEVKRIDQDDYIMTKRCFNDKWEDEWLQGCRVVDATLMGVNNPAQQQGSAITYARRYSLLMAFGLATEDDDAQSLSEVREVTEEEANNYTLGFGKHKGKKLNELPRDYVEWLINNSKDQRLIKMIEMTTGVKAVSEEEAQKMFEKMKELNELINQTGTIRESIYSYYGVSSNSEMSLEDLDDAISKLKEKL